MSDKRIALVTGANRGIGLEIARQLHAEGLMVIAAARDLQKASKAASTVGEGSIGIALDLKDEHSVQLAAKEISQSYDHLDVLVNNAGVIGNDNMLDFNIDEINQVMQTNFMGPILTIKYFMGLLKKSSDARIINMSSGMGELLSLQNGGYAAYRLSKSALNAFTILLDAELRNGNIKVFSVCPGWVKTDMGGKNAPLSVKEGADTASWLANAKNAESGKFYRNRKVIDW